jgi:peroxiredoxin
MLRRGCSRLGQQSILARPAVASRASSVRAYALSVGDKLPEAKFRYFDSEGNMKELGTEQLCKGKKVVLFAVPGAFTPTCSMKHLPGFIEKAEEIKVGNQGGVNYVCSGLSTKAVVAVGRW